MQGLLGKGLFTVVLAWLMAATAHAALLQSISVTGQIVPENTFGTLAHHVGRNFNYEATFELDVNKAVNTWVNGGGWTVYELNDGGVRYRNRGCIYDGGDVAGGDCISSNIVAFEFNDNLTENWATEAGFLNLGVADGTPLDAIVLGFWDPLIPDETEVWVTLLFQGDLFEGYDPLNLPASIDLATYVGGGGEFAQWDGALDDWKGFAQFRVDGVSVSAVPLPATVWMLMMGVCGLMCFSRPGRRG